MSLVPYSFRLGDPLSDVAVSDVIPTKSISWQKKVLFVLVGTIFLLVLLFCLGEVGLRILGFFWPTFRSTAFRQYDPELGISLIPNTHAFHHMGCFSGEVEVNRWGMRDRGRLLEKTPGEFRIALIGDSLVEAPHVKPDEVMNIRMEKLLAEKGYKNVEVLNFSVEGIGTTQEYLIYQRQVRQFHPDVVILATVANDVMNNSSTLQPKAYGIHTWYAPYYDLGPDGNLIFRPVEARSFNSIRSFLETHSRLTYYLVRAWMKFVNYSPYKWDGIYIGYRVCSDQLDAEWEQAWAVTDKVLNRFRNDVQADGAKFVVMVPPEFYQTDLNWKEWFTKDEGKIPATFSETAFDKRMQQIAARNQIAVDFLAPYFQAYRDEHHLQYPYFSFTCNHHYSALGHEVAAEAMIQKMEERHLLPPRSASEP